MQKYFFNYCKLDGRIHEICGNRKTFAKLMGLSETTISKKLTNKTYFTQKEIEKAVDVLGIDRGSISTYFFAPRL